MNLTPLDLLDARPWRRVAFTTYAVSLSFFEAVILDRLVRGRGSQALILTDVKGLQTALSEQGAQRVGKDYALEPVAITGGIFHPKITLLADGKECHLLVGSGNLTFGGWGGNCEVLEHLHPSFAATAIADAAVFFERLPDTDRVRLSTAAQCKAIADDLHHATTGETGDGTIRFIHSLDTAIVDQIAQFAADLGGASRLVTMAPFYDGGTAVGHLCHALGLAELFVHAHEHGCVEGAGVDNWPRECSSAVQAVQLDLFDGEKPRRLHAKAFEILCRRGRIVVSGSANGTTAALGPKRNIEACIVRVQRGRRTGWRHRPTEPIALPSVPDDEHDKEDASTGVLWAVLKADKLAGSVLTPKMTGAVTVFLVTATGPERIAETTLSANGAFSVTASPLEQRSWTGGRLVIRVRDTKGRQADGFVSVASFWDVARRVGSLGPRLFALLGGTETPADVAAIMSWFHEEPERLVAAASDAAIVGSREHRKEQADQQIPVVALNEHYVDGTFRTIAHSHASQRSWSRFMAHIFAAVRVARTPFGQTAAGGIGDDDADDVDRDRGNGSDNDDPPTTPTHDPAIEKSLAVFERLFDLLTEPDRPPRLALISFDLTQYVCARLRPDAEQARTWLKRLIRRLLETGVPEERRDDVAAAVVTLAATAPDKPACRLARDCLLRLGVDMEGTPPDAESVSGFAAVLPPRISFMEIWPRLQALRTYREQVRGYLRALEKGAPSENDYPDLEQDANEEWPILKAAIVSDKIRRRRLVVSPHQADACPRCFVRLPTAEEAKLQSKRIATAKGCCGRVVIWAGD